MNKNPFIISGQIPDEYFCDRKWETKELIRLVTNGNNVVLFSPRRMGKTGLIRHCYGQPEIKENYYTFFVDILQTNSLKEFIFLLSKEIFNVLVPRNKKMVMKFVQTLKSFAGKFGIDNVSGYPTFNIQLGDIVHPELTLEEIFSYLSLADKPCIVAIDEFQQIVNYPEKNIEAILRSHIQQSTNSYFIFSGSKRHILQEIFLSSARPFYNSSTMMELGCIPENDYVEFICRMFAQNQKEIDLKDAVEIYKMTEGHTFFIQKICNESFSYTAASSKCDDSIIHQAINNILGSYAPLYRQNLSDISLKQKEVLYAIALEHEAKNITSSEFIRKHSLSSSSSVQSAVGALLKRDLISKEDETYRVNDFFFLLWLRNMLEGNSI